MNETLTNFLHFGRKFGGKRGKGKKIPSGAAVNQETLQEEQHSGPSRQYNSLAESQNDKSGDKEEYDGTTCKVYKTAWIELTEKCGDWIQSDICDEYIYPKCYDKRDVSADDDFFVVFASDHKC